MFKDIFLSKKNKNMTTMYFSSATWGQ